MDIQVLPDSALGKALKSTVAKYEAETQKITELPSDWLERKYYIPEPRDPLTDRLFPPGPIILADIQKRLFNEALSRTEDKLFKYSLVVWSAPKKSGKSALAAGAALYLADTMPFAPIYCLANDGKQSDDRLYQPIAYSLEQHQKLNLSLKSAEVTKLKATLENGSFIEPLKVDASGEAGSNPAGVFMSEVWGWMEEGKKRLYAEMTLPPTRWGRSIQWVESYAGYQGQSDLLRSLYELGLQGEPHPDFMDLIGRNGEYVVRVNPEAGLFFYWDTLPRLAWQNEDYYKRQAKTLSDSEFKRLHWNEWQSSIGAFIAPESWDACAKPELPPLFIGSQTPVVLGVDLAISGDCAAVIAVTRDPFYPELGVAVRWAKIFKPEPGKPINVERDVGKAIRDACRWWNVVCVAYDPYQMESLVQNYKQGIVSPHPTEMEGMSDPEKQQYIKDEGRIAQNWYLNFNQQGKRAIADKSLKDMIIEHRISWNPADTSDVAEQGLKDTVSRHVKTAGAKEVGGKLRLEKLSEESKIDGAVGLSMAAYQCMFLDLDNREIFVEDVIRDFQRGKINYEEYEQRRLAAIQAKRVRDGNAG